MTDFKCQVCGGPTEQIWESPTKTRYAMRCINGHRNAANKSDSSMQYSTFLVSSEDLVK